MIVELPLKYDATRAAIDFLEKQGYSIVEWVEFDSSDESTWPKFGLSYYVDSNEYGYTKAYFKNDGNWVCYGDIITTTVEAYSKLPQRKESK